MRRTFLLCLAGIFAPYSQAATSNQPQPVQPFTAVIWTTTTLHNPAGKSFTFMRRTVSTRDRSGSVRTEIYRPTKGPLHDISAPLEHVLTRTTSPQDLSSLRSSKETSQQEADLGTREFSGVPATGRRRTFLDANGQPAHMVETWFCATLGLTVRSESRNARGDAIVSDLYELHLNDPAPSSAEAVTDTARAIPLLRLYRVVFAQIAHMERDRLANDPNLHANMDEIEGHLRKKLGLSISEWQVLVDKSVKVESFTREMSMLAGRFAQQYRAGRRENSVSASTTAATRSTLHKMQLDLNARVQREIDQLATAVGPDATTGIEAYLKGPLAASTHAVPLRSVQAQAQHAPKEQQ